jgi:hypothetical protein
MNNARCAKERENKSMGLTSVMGQQGPVVTVGELSAWTNCYASLYGRERPTAVVPLSVTYSHRVQGTNSVTLKNSSRWMPLVAILLITWTATAATASELREYLVAKHQFDELTAHGIRQQHMPRMRDPSFASVFNTLTSTEAFLERSSFKQTDLDTLMQVCNASQQLPLAYIYFGLDDISRSAMLKGQNVTEVLPRVSHNTVEFQDEITSLQIFSTVCFAKALPLITKDISGRSLVGLNNTQHAGILNIKIGAAKMIAGIAGTAADSAITMSNRNRLVSAASAVAPAFAAGMDASLRKQVREYLLALAPRVPQELSVQFDLVTNALDNSECNALCLAR